MRNLVDTWTPPLDSRNVAAVSKAHEIVIVRFHWCNEMKNMSDRRGFISMSYQAARRELYHWRSDALLFLTLSLSVLLAPLIIRCSLAHEHARVLSESNAQRAIALRTNLPHASISKHLLTDEAARYYKLAWYMRKLPLGRSICEAWRRMPSPMPAPTRRPFLGMSIISKILWSMNNAFHTTYFMMHRDFMKQSREYWHWCRYHREKYYYGA